MQFVNTSEEVIEKIIQMLNENGFTDRNIRIVGSLGFGDIPEGFKLMPAEANPRDQVQEFEGITFIAADILIKLYGSFTITYEEKYGQLDFIIKADKR